MNRIEPRYEALERVCEKHFPDLAHDRRAELAGAYDHIVRGHLQRSAFRDGKLGRDGEKSRSSIFKRMRNAIDKRDRELWHSAYRKMDEIASDLYYDSIGALKNETSHCLSLGDWATEVLGPTLECYNSDPVFWEIRNVALLVALRKLPPGRPAYNNRDNILRELIALWSELSGRKPKQPTSVTASSKRSGSLPDFVNDAVNVYADVGLIGANSLNSGATWQRLLKKFEQ